jgi:DNA-binding Lrp family transcriptional regulator
MVRDDFLRALCGSGSRARLFQALFRSRDGLPLRALSEAAGVDPAHVHRLLPQLLDAGVCERIDARPHPRYRAAAQHPLYAPLSAVFSGLAMPTAGGREPPMRRAEERSLLLHSSAMRRVREDPSALERARATLDRWISRYGDDAPQALREWSRILSLPADRIEAVALERSERGDRLRKSSPLSTLVPRDERRRIHAAR